jgi:hypothetical protein
MSNQYDDFLAAVEDNPVTGTPHRASAILQVHRDGGVLHSPPGRGCPANHPRSTRVNQMRPNYENFLEAIKGDKVVFYFLEYQHKTGSYSFSGSCAPIPGTCGPWETFSVGIFQWQEKARGPGLKPGKAIIRVTGSTDNPSAVYEMAMDLCRRLQDGERFQFKSISAARLKIAA